MAYQWQCQRIGVINDIIISVMAIMAPAQLSVASAAENRRNGGNGVISKWRQRLGSGRKEKLENKAKNGVSYQ
jgi:hypothetical protein